MFRLNIKYQSIITARQFMTMKVLMSQHITPGFYRRIFRSFDTYFNVF